VVKTNNISPDSRIINLRELNLAEKEKIFRALERIEKQFNERFDRIEAYIGMTEHEKNKPSSTYTTEEVMEMLHVTRNTLKNYRDKNLIIGIKPGKRVLYTTEEINRIKNKKV
jgi:glycyl-tRNA synthetase (class II)